MKKLIASLMAALMAALTLASPALAATALNTYPTFLGKSGSIDYYVVVGEKAATSDVVGAIDVASNLAQLSYTSVTTSGASAVNGISKDGISIGTSSGGSGLDSAISGGSAFPSGAIVKNAHYTALKDSTFSWKSNDYDYREQVDLSGVMMRHDLTTDKINGTETMMVGDNDITYEFVFEKAVNLSTATTTGNTGTISNPEYTNPITVKLLGKSFTIVGVGTTSIKALIGSTGTAVKDGTTSTPVVSGDYTIYVTAGSDNSWARFDIKDSAGNVKDSVSITKGESKDSSTTGLTIKVTTVRVAGTDPATQHIEADVVIGPTGTVDHEYDQTADVSSTGTSNDAFPGESAWGIQYSPAAGAASGYIPVNSKVQVVYKPASVTDGDTKYLRAGSTVVLPNNYGTLGFDGFNTNDLATVTIRPWGSGTVYNSTGNQVATNLYGFEISASKNILTSNPGGNLFTKAYLVFNASRGTNSYPVALGFYDAATGHIIVNDSWAPASLGTVGTGEYPFGVLNDTAGTRMTYALKLNNGEYDYYLNLSVTGFSATGTILNITAGSSAASTSIQMLFQDKTAWSTTASPQFRLGGTAGSGDDNEVKATTEGSLTDASKKTQEIVDDSGLIISSTSSSTGSDSIVLKVPAKALGVSAYFGVKGSSTAAGTVNKVVPVTSAVAKLDSEVSSADESAKSLVLVGGPCVNTIAQALVDSGKLSANYTCSGQLGSAWTADTSYIVVVDQPFGATGTYAVVAAGTSAKDTRLASQYLLQYADKLKDITSGTAKITTSTGAVVAAS